MSEPLLEVRGLSKRFPGVQALEEVNLRIARGEVLGLVGENGAGKSTLMKILAGIEQPDGGEILVEGRPVRFASVREASGLGITLIHQELNLCETLDVGANIFLGREPRRWGWIDRRTVEARSRELLGQVGLDCAPSTRVETLSIGRRQMVEIAKAFQAEARVLIMDEPTSSLTQAETERLLKLTEGLRERGVAVIYISHRLGEVRRLADRVVVLRDGKNAGELPRGMIDHDLMVKLMVGRELSQTFPRSARTRGAPVLEARGLRTRAHASHAIDLTLHAGEIVGLAGLVGAGRTEILEALFGITSPAGGEVKVDGRPLAPGDPRAAIRAGLALAPEDRKQHGLILEWALRPNVSLPGLFARGALGDEARAAREAIEKLSIKTSGDGQVVGLLSGGNQQKVVLGKWLALKPRIILLDEPTRGIDVGSKQEIYRIIDALAAGGTAVLLVSSELEEILGMSDRVVVMHEGRVTGELPRESLREEAVMHLAFGAA